MYRDQQACFCLLITGVQEHELQLSTLPVLATRSFYCHVSQTHGQATKTLPASETPTETLPQGKSRESILLSLSNGRYIFII